MKKFDPSICPYIERNMWFITFSDFCGRRKGIKRLYAELDIDSQILYKWYVYSNVHMSEKFKNAIWDYLNFDDVEFECDLTRLERYYTVK